MPASGGLPDVRAILHWHVHDSKLLIDPIIEVTDSKQAKKGKVPLIWNLQPIADSPESIALSAQFVTARHIDATGALLEMDSSSLRNAWSTLAGRH